MRVRRPRPDHLETHFQIDGPLKIEYSPGHYMAGWCHRCYWSQYSGDESWLREIILWHLWDRHDPTPKPVSKNVMPPPGR